MMMAYAGHASNVLVERASRICFGKDGALAELLSLFEKSVGDASRAEDDRHALAINDEDSNLHGIEGIMAMPELVVLALALSVHYLKDFGMERIVCFGSSFQPFSADTEMPLSANALQQLEVLKNNTDGTKEGSLFQTMNNTCTAFGSRLFRNWFVGVIQSILTAGKQLRKLVPEDAGTLYSQHKPVHSSLLRRLISTASSSTVLNNAVKLLSYLNKDAADQGDMLNLLIASVDHFPEVAEGRVAVEMAKQKLDLLIVEYRKQLAMHTLEFKSVAGTTHLIELPVDRRVPSNWLKINGRKKTIRYHTPEILKNLDSLMLAKEELAVICWTSWHKFLINFGKYYAQFQATVESLAALDCL